MRNTLRTVAGLSAAVLAASALVSCSTDEDATVVTVTSTSQVVTSPAGTPSSEPTEDAEDPGDEGDAASSADDAVAPALATLDTLEVKGRAPKTGYDRALFGQAWADVDRNGCDTRVIYSSQQGCLPTVLFRVHFSENSQGMSDRGTFATRSGMQA